MNRYSQTRRLDLLDLAEVGGVGLDEQVVDLRRDRVGVLGHERREQVRPADRSMTGRLGR